MTRTISWSIKICGVTSIADAEAVQRSGATAIGLNFYSRSLRSVPVPLAAEIVTSLRRSGLQGQRVGAVGVFVNHSAAEILEIAEATGIEWIQLHGDETSDIVAALQSRPVMRVIRPDPSAGFEAALNESNRWINAGVTAILLDAPFPRVPDPDDDEDDKPESYIESKTKQYGGAGRTVDWKIARKLVQQLSVPVVLAGGLNPENVQAAIKAVAPAAVDVASGVEELPARKDSSLVELFVSRANVEFARLQSGR